MEIDRGVAENYDELPLWSAPFGQLILDRVPLRRGQTVVDIGAGTGFLTVELAQRSAARVIAVDPWADAMDVLRRKVEYLGLRDVELVVSDAARLELPDGSVDVVVSNLGINNFANAATVLAECHRVLRPGGHLLISTNLVGHMQEFYDVLREVVGASAKLDEHLGHRATVEGTLDLLTTAGFAATADRTQFSMRFADGTALLDHYFIRLGFLDGWLDAVGPEALHATEQQLNRRGELTLTIPAACFTAVRS
ncbi:Methyltransferase type 11 [Kribbella flavida DSM 17836]|uniref:Methyltransferase type 11 n=1 Tax=Kribbella flavida (strain DSM 17836 / JCM 10339 / NBRC 14399) TaxID=479435 RepID=D2PLP2_KRIFD|nr:methyltransferase domain-containing protein [Kribbella flavida]ADB30671.1 Methyltransferase type 11 [Kribbella flavida DSM 17836]